MKSTSASPSATTAPTPSKAIYTSARGGLFLNASTAVSISPYTNLRFAVRYDGTGGSLAGSQVIVKLYDPSNQPTGQQALTNYVSEGSLASDTWYDVTIPLVDLGASTSSIKGFSVQNGSTTTLFVDVVRFASEEVPLTNVIRYVLTDHLGGTNLVTDTSGNILQAIDYYPFGQERIASGDATDRHYIGERFDAATNLNYLNARYYDSARGQFTSQDPVFWELRQNLRDPQSLNSYGYAGGNPISRSDAAGRSYYTPAIPLVAFPALAFNPGILLGVGAGAIAIGGAVAIPWVLSEPLQNISTPPFDPSQLKAGTEQITYEPLANIPNPEGNKPNPNAPKWMVGIMSAAGTIAFGKRIYDSLTGEIASVEDGYLINSSQVGQWNVNPHNGFQQQYNSVNPIIRPPQGSGSSQSAGGSASGGSIGLQLQILQLQVQVLQLQLQVFQSTRATAP